MRAAALAPALALAAALALGGCAGTRTAALVDDPHTQDMVLEVLIARAIEATAEPARTAHAVQALATADPAALELAPVPDIVRAHLDYAARPASERLLIDRLAAALAADVAHAIGPERMAALARWRRVAVAASAAVLSTQQEHDA